jgi:hypothetical protein
MQYVLCVFFGLALDPQTRFAKKHFLKYRTVLSYVFDLLSFERVAPSPIRVEKKILQNSLHRVSKEAKFFTDLKYVQKS